MILHPSGTMLSFFLIEAVEGDYRTQSLMYHLHLRLLDAAFLSRSVPVGFASHQD